VGFGFPFLAPLANNRPSRLKLIAPIASSQSLAAGFMVLGKLLHTLFHVSFDWSA
jgi:hypothetical protein